MESVCSRLVCASGFVAAVACGWILSAQAVSQRPMRWRDVYRQPRVRAVRSGIELARADVSSAQPVAESAALRRP